MAEYPRGGRLPPALAELGERDRARITARPQPRAVEPMKATLAERPFSDERWIFERKLDGVRCIAVRTDDQVRLLSRTGKALDRTYPELAEALQAQCSEDAVLDGEIVAFDGDLTSFARLQQRMQIQDAERARRSDVDVFLYLFDVLHLAGYDTSQLPLRARKELLRSSLTFDDPIRFTDHRDRDGEAFYREACEQGWEGLIAKRAEGRYARGRSREWLKLKCALGQELVIGGYTEPKGSRTGFGALLLGYYEDDELTYAGKVGTGFDEETLRGLHARLAGIGRESPPFNLGVRLPREARWTEPQLVAQVAFTEWTRNGQLRHPRFLGLRDDKRPQDVVRE